MGMSDCAMCWNTPCTCGWSYRRWSTAQLDAQIDMLILVRNFNKQNPEAKYSWRSLTGPETEDDERLLEALRNRR